MPFLQRNAVRCPHCEMNQFVTASGLCRRCHKGLLPEPAPPVVAPVQVREFTFEPQKKLEIATLIRELRLERNLSQRQLADRMATKRTYISKIENGRVMPTVALLKRFAAALRVDVSALLSGDKTETLLSDPFMKGLAFYVSRLDNEHRAILLNTACELAAKEKQYDSPSSILRVPRALQYAYYCDLPARRCSYKASTLPQM